MESFLIDVLIAASVLILFAILIVLLRIATALEKIAVKP